MRKLPPDYERERERIMRIVFNKTSHDLKTPLSCIIGSLEIISQMKEMLSAEQKETLINTALTEARRLDILVSRMLEKAKAEKPKPETDKQEAK